MDDALVAITASISIGKNPILLGTKIDSLRRLGRAVAGALAATFGDATIFQVQCTTGSELSFRISRVTGDGWIVASWFTDRPDLLLRFDLVDTAARWRAVVLTTARYQALSRGLASTDLESFAFIDAQL
jgi:hypothetical protein